MGGAYSCRTYLELLARFALVFPRLKNANRVCLALSSLNYVSGSGSGIWSRTPGIFFSRKSRMHPAIFIIAFPYSSFLSKKNNNRKKEKKRTAVWVASVPLLKGMISRIPNVQANKSRQYRLNRSIDSYGWAGIIVELGLVPNVPKRFQKLKPFCLPGTLVCHSVDKVSRRLHTLYFVLIVVSNRLCHSLLPKSVSLQSFWNLVRPIEETKIGKMLLSFH